MKKRILSLLIFCSVLLQAQIQIPQVVGLPAALNSKVDKVIGKSLVPDTLSAKIQPTAIAVTTKEPLLPSPPSNPESRFLNGNKQWAEIVLGSGGYASNVYFTNLTSTIVGSYKQTSGTHELTETIASGTCNNNEVLIHTYLFEQPVGITTVDAGVWRFTMNCAINSNVGDSKFKIVQFRRSSTGVETDMFTIYSNTIENTDYQNFIIETVQPSFLVDSLDRFGCRIYATTTTTVNKIISYKVGDGYASYLNTPLALRHPQLRDPNGNPNVQHLTAAQVTKVNNTSGINTGDETLTSIKTKLGAASSVSDGYLRYQDFALLHAPTTVTASNGLSISGQNISLQNASLAQSGALTFNDWNTFNGKEPAITKNSGFNLPLGNTPGTVLEGRTFGTAANSAVGDFIQNQNSSAQSANTWISGYSQSNGIQINGRVNEPSSIGSIAYLGYNSSDVTTRLLFGDGTGYSFTLAKKNGGVTTDLMRLQDNGAATFSSTVTSTGFLLNGNNLTSSLSTNSLPKWNGSSMVNSLISDDGSSLTMIKSSGDASFKFKSGTNACSFGSDATAGFIVDNGLLMWYGQGGVNNFYRECKVLTTTQSTSSTTGALVVNGGIGADHVRANNFYGNGSNLTGVQLPITLTTNGTSGAATFSGNVLNVPNYTVSGFSYGVYSPTVTAIAGISTIGTNTSYYTNIGSIYHVSSLIGLITNVATNGTCTVQITLPSTPTSATSISVIGTAGDTVQAYYNGGSSNTIQVTFKSPVASGAGLTVKITADYY